MLQARIVPLLTLVLSLWVTSSSFAAPLADQKLVFLVKTGTDSSGNALMRVADSSEANLAQLYARISRDSGVQKVIESHQKEQLRSFQAVTPVGMHNQRQADPVFVEVGTQTGTYNDWKGSFTIVDGNNQQFRYDQARVVVDLNDSMFRAKDPTLVEQNFVHEIGHGIMRQTYGKDNLPTTPWLGRPHYGDLVTDEALGIIEGWAEFVGAYFTGRNTIAEDPAEAIMQNAYAYTDKGTPKSPADLMKTEGWVATVLLWIAKHPSVVNGYDKMLTVMREGKHSSLNEMLKLMIARYPELEPTIGEILGKASLGQFTQPLGEPLPSSAQANQPTPMPPAVDTATNIGGNEDGDLKRIFDDFQSSMNTLAQLKLDLINLDRYANAHWQEVQRRISFQESLVANLEARLIAELKLKTGISNQDQIAHNLLDNLEKIRLNHNQLIQEYNKLGFWDQGKRSRIQAELGLYQQLYNRMKNMADQADPAVMLAVWNQRQSRIAYRLQQASQVVAAPQTSKEQCLGANDCANAYNKLLEAIKANERGQAAQGLLEKYQNSSEIR